MVNPTPRFNLDRFDRGEDWSHSDTVEFVDEHTIERGAIADRPAEGNYDEEFFYATDEKILYIWDETNVEWVVAIEAEGGTAIENWEWVDVTDLGHPTDGSEDTAALIENNLADNRLLIFPPGQYTFDGTATIAGVEDFGLHAPQGGATFSAGDMGDDKGLIIIGQHDNLANRIRISGMNSDVTQETFLRVRGQDVLVKDIHFTQEREQGKNTYHIIGRSPTENGRVRFENIQMPEGGSYDGTGDLSDAPGGFFVFSDHEGTMIFRDCEVGGFPNNGIYASAPGLDDGANGAIKIFGGQYYNSGVSCLRVGGDGSVIRDANIWYDTIKDNFGGLRGIYIRNGDNIVIDNVRIRLASNISGATGIRGRTTTKRITVRNSLVIDNGSNRALRISNNSETAFIDGFKVKGSADDTTEQYPIFIERDDTVLKNIEIDQPNRRGMTISGDNVSVEGGRANVSVYGVRFTGRYGKVSEWKDTSVIRFDADDIRVIGQNISTSGSGTQDRIVINGWSTNEGDPSVEGEWSGHGYEGVSVVDTINDDHYIYRDGWLQIGGGEGVDSNALDMGHADVVVTQRGVDDYAAIEYPSGNEVASGSNGIIVLQDGINAANANDTIRVRGHYTLANSTNSVSIGDGKHLVGTEASISITTLESSAPIRINNGSQTSAVTTLSADITEGQNELPVNDASAFSEGQLLRINSSEAFSSRTGAQAKGELHLVETVNTTDNVIRTQEPFQLDYTASNTDIDRITPESATIEGFYIEGSNETSDELCIQVYLAKDVLIDNVELANAGYRLIDVNQSYGTTIRNSHLSKSNKGGDGYGIRVRSGCANTRIVDNTIRHCRHCVAHSANSGDGLPYGTYIANNTLTGTTEGAILDTHDGAISWTIYENQAYSYDSAFVQNGARICNVKGNEVRGIEASENNTTGSLYRTENTHSWEDAVVIITNNYHRGSTDAAIKGVDGGGVIHETFKVSNNHFERSKERIMRIGADIQVFIFDDNTTEGGGVSDGHAFRVRNGAQILSGSISDNYFSRLGRNFFWNDSGGPHTELVISGNKFFDSPQDSGRSCLNAMAFVDSIIKDNTFLDPNGTADTAIDINDACERVFIKDNEISHDGTVTPLSDDGVDTRAVQNWENDGTGWTQLTDI